MRNLLVRVGADISGMTNGMNKAAKQLEGFGSRIDKMFGGIKGQIASALAGIGGALAIKEGTQDAIQYEAIMGTLGESMGKSRQDFIKWQNQVGSSMGFSKLEGAKLANTLSLNFKKIATDSQDLVSKTTKMMEIAGLIANKRGMLMSEVSDRIRSAMNQEADGADELGVNVRIAAIQQSKAYQEMADGKPWDKLTENMRKTILYNHILEQVTANLGDSLQNNTQLKMANFTASLYDVRLALGQAFLPILSVVLPVLTKFMRKLESAFQYVSSFMRGLFGIKPDIKPTQQATQSTEKQADAVTGLGKAVESTAKKKKKADKEAKRGVMGFDEVNILADPTQASADTGGATGGGGGGGGGGGAMAPPDAGLPLQGGDPMGFEKIRKKAMELGATLRTMWEPIGKALKTAWEFVWSYIQIKFAGLRKFWKENGKQILEAWNNVWGFLLPILKWVGKFIWKSIKGLIDGVIKFFEGLLKFFAGVFTGDWGKAWEGIKDMVVGIFEIVLNWMNLSFVGGIRKLLLGGVKKFITIMSDLGKGMKGKWDEIWTGIKTGIGGKVQEVIAILKGKFDDMVATIYIVGDDILKGLVGGFKDIGGWFKTNVIDVIASTFTKYKGIISTKFEEVWTDFKSFWSGIYNWVRDNIIYKIRDSFVAYKTKITDKAKDIWTGITEKLSGAYTWVRDNIVYKIRDSFVAYKTKITDKAKDIMDGIKDKFTGIGTWFHKKVITPIQDAWTNIKTGFSGGFKSGVVAILNQGIKLINWWLGKFNTVLDLISKVVPGTIPHVKKIPEVKLAQGGITNGPVRALIGEAGREVVSPLDDLKSMISTAVMSAINFSGGGGTGGDIILNLDGRQFARIVKPHIDRENKRVGINVKLNSI